MFPADVGMNPPSLCELRRTSRVGVPVLRSLGVGGFPADVGIPSTRLVRSGLGTRLRSASYVGQVAMGCLSSAALA